MQSNDRRSQASSRRLCRIDTQRPEALHHRWQSQGFSPTDRKQACYLLVFSAFIPLLQPTVYSHLLCITWWTRLFWSIRIDWRRYNTTNMPLNNMFLLTICKLYCILTHHLFNMTFTPRKIKRHNVFVIFQPFISANTYSWHTDGTAGHETDSQ